MRKLEKHEIMMKDGSSKRERKEGKRKGKKMREKEKRKNNEGTGFEGKRKKTTSLK